MGRVVLLALSLSLFGCTAFLREPPPTTVAQLIERGRGEGIELVDPLEIDDDMVARVRKEVPDFEQEQWRVRNLIRFVKTTLEFDYQPHLSLTAKESYYSRRGDCMSYTHLFIALARRVGLNAYFVHVRDVRDYYESKGQFFVSSHVAAGVGTGPGAIVADFSHEQTDWKLSVYSPIDDASAAALFYNNVAVDDMLTGHVARAEKVLHFLVTQSPKTPEVYNNLGVLYNRESRYQEALDVLKLGISKFPNYEPLFTNGIRAANGAGDTPLERELERRGQAISNTDPYFMFARALRLFQDKQFERAATQLIHATDEKPEMGVFWAWLARVYAADDKRADATRAYKKAKELSPEHAVVKLLETEYPYLRL
jgi:tetratricopeptide (TPR) repeat protein